MAFDGIVTGAVVKELKEVLTGLRVDKIYQVEKDEIVLHFRKRKLLISSSGNNPRIYLSEEKKENPTQAPLFSMVLRKHLNGAMVKDIVQYGNDRVIEIIFDAWDEFSEKVQKSLLVEIMGRHSNIILLDENKIIIDAIKRVNENMSRVREVLPHLPYEYILSENKLDPLTATKDEIEKIIYSIEGNKTIENASFSYFTGFSKTIGGEIGLRAGLDPSRPMSSLENFDKDKLVTAIISIRDDINNSNYNNLLYLDGDKAVDFHVLDLESMKGLETREFPSPSKLLDFLYAKRDNDDRIGQKALALKKTVLSKLNKDKSKLANLEKDLLEAENREKFRIYADIISANFHNIKPGQKEVSLENFYDENLEKILIPLDEKLSAPQNAQKYYKKYGKLKTAENVLTTQINETKSEIDYLESVILEIELSENVEDLEATKDELIDQGYIKRRQTKKKKPKDVDFKEIDYLGYKVYLGRNNRENDLLTHKIARRDDLWFHVQGIPGSHVIIKDEGIDFSDEIIEFAARLAAYNSKARNTGSVEVDYTKKLNVKRHPANKPGLVNYTDFQTILVDSSQIKENN